MTQYEKIYSVKIKDKEYGFFLKLAENDKFWIAIPDCGGQADMIPRYRDQFEWIASKFKMIDGIKQIWGTIWEIRTKAALKEVEELFLEEGKISNKQSVDFYYED